MTAYDGSTGLMDIRLGVDKELATLLRDKPLCAGQSMTEQDGEMLVDLRLPPTEELLSWIHSMGSRVEVMHPPLLRELMRSSLEAAFNRYRLV
jgi:predicted DNA-binding transcriptional regulator YafY